MKFIQKVLAGLEFEDSIDDYVDEWHQSESSESLHDFLGMSFDQYSLWVENPDSLGKILFTEKNGVSLADAGWDDLHLMAARSHSQQDPAIFEKWLKDKGI